MATVMSISEKLMMSCSSQDCHCPTKTLISQRILLLRDLDASPDAGGHQNDAADGHPSFLTSTEPQLRAELGHPPIAGLRVE